MAIIRFAHIYMDQVWFKNYFKNQFSDFNQSGTPALYLSCCQLLFVTKSEDKMDQIAFKGDKQAVECRLQVDDNW